MRLKALKHISLFLPTWSYLNIIPTSFVFTVWVPKRTHLEDRRLLCLLLNGIWILFIFMKFWKKIILKGRAGSLLWCSASVHETLCKICSVLKKRIHILNVYNSHVNNDGILYFSRIGVQLSPMILCIAYCRCVPLHSDNCVPMRYHTYVRNLLEFRRRSVEYPPRSSDLTPLDFLQWKFCLHFKITYTAKPEAGNWNCSWRCSISNNTERLPVFCSLLSTMHFCWWWTFWTFVTLNVKVSQF
jgi:hypothetical protein